MNVTEGKARTMVCPILSIGKDIPAVCTASTCVWWEFDEPMFDGPDSYVAEPGPTGHCGVIKQEVRT